MNNAVASTSGILPCSSPWHSSCCSARTCSNLCCLAYSQSVALRDVIY